MNLNEVLKQAMLLNKHGSIIVSTRQHQRILQLSNMVDSIDIYAKN